MERIYAAGVKSDVKLFVGTEVEHTPAYGLRTLFLVGLHDISHVKQTASACDCQHIYIGANQSFDPGDWRNGNYEQSDQWHTFIKNVLDIGLTTTLDFDVQHIEWVLEGCYVEYQNFIPQISVKIPYLNQLGYNATLKIDDKDFSASNPGVWCHSLHDLLSRQTFTSWTKYKEDVIL